MPRIGCTRPAGWPWRAPASTRRDARCTSPRSARPAGSTPPASPRCRSAWANAQTASPPGATPPRRPRPVPDRPADPGRSAGVNGSMTGETALRVGAWAQRRRFRAEGFVPERLAAQKTSSVSMVIPTRECGATITGVLDGTVGPLVAEGLVDEVVVVDAGSRDGTAELAAAHGARIVQQDEVLTEFGPALGK